MYIFVALIKAVMLLFVIGLWGIIVVRANLMVILMSIELLLFSISLQFVAFSAFFDDLAGQIFSLFILMIAAAESAIGLAILVIHYRLRGSLNANFLVVLKT